MVRQDNGAVDDVPLVVHADRFFGLEQTHPYTDVVRDDDDDDHYKRGRKKRFDLFDIFD